MLNTMNIAISDEMKERIEKRAAALGISRSAYVRRCIASDLGEDIFTDEAEEQPKNMVRIYLTDEREAVISDMAKEYGMSIREYLTRVASLSMPPRSQICIDDLNLLGNAVNDFTESISITCGEILRTGEANKKDIDEIRKVCMEVRSLFNKKFATELEERKRLYADVKGKIIADDELIRKELRS